MHEIVVAMQISGSIVVVSCLFLIRFKTVRTKPVNLARDFSVHCRHDASCIMHHVLSFASSPTPGKLASTSVLESEVGFGMANLNSTGLGCIDTKSSE